MVKAYAGEGFRVGDFPLSEQAADQVLSLPMFPGLSPEQQQRVAACVLESTRATGRLISVTAAGGSRS
jgi:dTDP-4-amino-4,6-dideoxygalactose transaminase